MWLPRQLVWSFQANWAPKHGQARMRAACLLAVLCPFNYGMPPRAGRCSQRHVCAVREPRPLQTGTCAPCWVLGWICQSDRLLDTATGAARAPLQGYPEKECKQCTGLLARACSTTDMQASQRSPATVAGEEQAGHCLLGLDGGVGQCNSSLFDGQCSANPAEQERKQHTGLLARAHLVVTNSIGSVRSGPVAISLGRGWQS